jgi:hypothetical protein
VSRRARKYRRLQARYQQSRAGRHAAIEERHITRLCEAVTRAFNSSVTDEPVPLHAGVGHQGYYYDDHL